MLDEYKVTWDNEITGIQGARDRYQKTPGFAGIILGKTSLGIRIKGEAYNEAMNYLGKDPGELYELRGVPLQANDTMITEILQQMGWQAQLVEGSRRVYRGLAIYKIRATTAPDNDVLRTCFDGELVQIQIAKMHNRQIKPTTKTMQGEPETWAASARRTIGIQKPDLHKEAPTVPSMDEQDADNDDEQMDQEQPEEKPVQQNRGLKSAGAGGNWQRRLPEPAPKARRVTHDDQQGDTRLDQVIRQLEQLSQVVAGLSAVQQQMQSAS